MRLTLRTLLAYLDDRLPPANAREIGQKIANSPFTTDLVERIKDVKRRRRLADPGKTQPMIEPNLIAEYLDDQLTPDLVARVEREILVSDAMLAEVAAAHEILGLLRDPVTVDPRLRDRLYGFDPSGKTAIARALNADASASGEPERPASEWKPLTVQRAPSRRTPGMVAGVFALIWLAVLISDSTFFGPRKTQPVPVAEVAGADGKAEDANAAAANAPADREPVVEADGTGAEVDLADNKIPPAVKQKDEKTVPDPQVNAAANPAESKPPKPNVVVADNGDPSDSANAASTEKRMVESPPAGSPSTSPTTPPITPTVPEVPIAVEPEIPVSYYLQVDSRSLLVQHDAMGRWRSFAQVPGGDAVENAPNSVNCGPIMGPSWFGVTERFPLVITTGTRGYVAELLGPCLVRMQRGSSGGLDLLTGRLRLTANPAVAWNSEARPEFNLGVGLTTARLTLGSMNTRVALEVTPIMPVMADSTANSSSLSSSDEVNDTAEDFLQIDSDLQVVMTVLEGFVLLQSEEQADSRELKQNQRAIWTVAGLKDSSNVMFDDGDAVSALPAWYFESSSEPLAEVTKQNLSLLESLSKNSEPGDSVQPLLEERNPHYGVLAVQVLSLTRDTDRLLSVLFSMKDESIHRAAIDGLTAIINSSSAGRNAVRLGLETRIPKAEAEPIVQLLKGLTLSQAADPTVVVDLMAMLESERPVARTLAIYRMEQITKDRKGFHPDADSSRRRDAIRRWQRSIDQNAGKLVP